MLHLLLLLTLLHHHAHANHFRPDSACVTTEPIAGSVQSFTSSTGETRCFTVYRPETAPSPAAVVVYFHDRGEDAIECGRVGGEFVQQAYRDGFALVCAEASDVTGVWRFGNNGIVNDLNANPCDATTNVEAGYLTQIFKYVRTKTVADFMQTTSLGQLSQNTNPALSIDRLYVSGYGEGSNFAAFVAFCYPSSVSGFVQAGGHGYKVKGDGVLMDDGAGECANCQYFPAKVLPALSIGRSFRHCSFTRLNDNLSPLSLHQKMCASLNDNGHSSTMYVDGSSNGGVQGRARPTSFMARAALCLQIGGATAPAPPPPFDCGTTIPNTPPTNYPVVGANYGASLSSSSSSSSIQGGPSSSSLTTLLAVTGDLCPAWDWVPSMTSHQCPCGCNGILPNVCSDVCSDVTLLRRATTHQDQKKMQASFDRVAKGDKGKRSATTGSTTGSTTGGTTGSTTSEFIACPPGTVPSTPGLNFCMSESVTTTRDLSTSTFRLITSGCPAHNVDNHADVDRGAPATYQQYTVELPLLPVDAQPLLNSVPSFGGPVGVAIDGAFLYNTYQQDDISSHLPETGVVRQIIIFYKVIFFFFPSFISHFPPVFPPVPPHC